MKSNNQTTNLARISTVEVNTNPYFPQIQHGQTNIGLNLNIIPIQCSSFIKYIWKKIGINLTLNDFIMKKN